MSPPTETTRPQAAAAAASAAAASAAEGRVKVFNGALGGAQQAKTIWAESIQEPHGRMQ